MRSDKNVRLVVSQEKFVWAANAATTLIDFNFNMQKLAEVNPAAKFYLDQIPVKQWTLYPHYRTARLYGWRTTNFVESEQARSLKLEPRLMLPYEYFKAYATIIIGESYMRSKLSKTWIAEQRLLTPRAEHKFQRELRDSANYSVAFSSDSVAFVSRVDVPLKQQRVEFDVNGPHCSCVQWCQHGLPCRHVIAVSHAREGMEPHAVIRMAASCYKVSNYKQGLVALEVPEESTLMRDDSLLPAQVHRQAVRPRKRRIRSRGEAGRVRKLYKCGKCGKTDGHNSASCRANV